MSKEKEEPLKLWELVNLFMEECDSEITLEGIAALYDHYKPKFQASIMLTVSRGQTVSEGRQTCAHCAVGEFNTTDKIWCCGKEHMGFGHFPDARECEGFKPITEAEKQIREAHKEAPLTTHSKEGRG